MWRELRTRKKIMANNKYVGNFMSHMRTPGVQQRHHLSVAALGSPPEWRLTFIIRSVRVDVVPFK